MPGRHHEDDDNLVIGSEIDEGMARSLLSRSTGYRMDLESETFVVASPVRASDGHHGHLSGRGDGADNLIAFQPNSSRTDEEWRENESPPVKKGSGGLGAVPPAFAGPQGVRRLTPLECERLQGWPDDWTRWAADGREIPDSHRYRLCGNGVVAPVAEYIAHRLVEVSR